MTDKSMLAAARQKLQEKSAEVNGIASAFKVDESGNFEISKKQHSDYTAAVRAAQEAKAFIETIEQADSIAAYLAEPEGKSEAGLDAGGYGGGSDEVKSLYDVFTGSEEFKSAQSQGFRVGRISGEFEGKSIHSLSAGNMPAMQALGRQESVGFTERQLRKTRIRDLFPKSSTRASVLWGIREVGWVNNAQQVRQRTAADGTYGALDAETDRTYTPGGAGAIEDPESTAFSSNLYGKKPKSKIMMKPVVYPVATIAHTLDAHKNILDDEPRLKTFLNTRMAEGVKYAEDFDLLHSVGDNAETLDGLFNVEHVGRYTGQASDKFSVQIRRAITKAQLAEYDPTGIVISPEMWEQIEVEEDGYGGFRVAVNVAVGAVKQVWHLDVAATTAMSDQNFLLGAFGLGAQLHDREAVSVTMSTENNDNYERNVVTFRAEERIALEVPRPEAFVVGTWTDYVA